MKNICAHLKALIISQPDFIKQSKYKRSGPGPVNIDDNILFETELCEKY